MRPCSIVSCRSLVLHAAARGKLRRGHHPLPGAKDRASYPIRCFIQPPVDDLTTGFPAMLPVISSD